MRSPRSVLVVGADGLVARALVRHLEAQGVAVYRTTRREGGARRNVVRLDLAADPAAWLELPRTDAAVLCAAVTGLAACEADPEGSARVNVTGTLALAARLVGQGTYTLFLSSDKVFDGSRPHRRRDDELCPGTEYGRQKAAAERGVLALGESAAVLRLAKVISPGLGLLRDWRRALIEGRPITPFHDMYLAPVGAKFVAELAARLLDSRRPGIFHVSGDEDISYVDLGSCLARALGAAARLVAPRCADPARLPPETRPRHSTLEMSLERSLFGLGAPASRAVCEKVAAALA